MSDAIEVMGKRTIGMALALLAIGWALTIWFVILAVVALIALFTVSPANPVPAPTEDPGDEPAPEDPQPPPEAG